MSSLRLGIVIIAIAAALSACKRHDMYTQDRLSNWDRSIFFAGASSMRPAIEGTVSRAEPSPDEAQPRLMTEAMLARGRQRYNIFCLPCHGASGDGQGMIVGRGFPRPAPLASAKVEHETATTLYDVTSKGQGTMYGFASRVPSADRWAIVAYIRALQQSQDADPLLLPEGDRAKLAALR